MQETVNILGQFKVILKANTNILTIKCISLTTGQVYYKPYQFHQLEQYIRLQFQNIQAIYQAFSKGINSKQNINITKDGSLILQKNTTSYLLKNQKIAMSQFNMLYQINQYIRKQIQLLKINFNNQIQTIKKNTQTIQNNSKLTNQLNAKLQRKQLLINQINQKIINNESQVNFLKEQNKLIKQKILVNEEQIKQLKNKLIQISNKASNNNMHQTKIQQLNAKIQQNNFQIKKSSQIIKNILQKCQTNNLWSENLYSINFKKQNNQKIIQKINGNILWHQIVKGQPVPYQGKHKYMFKIIKATKKQVFIGIITKNLKDTQFCYYHTQSIKYYLGGQFYYDGKIKYGLKQLQDNSIMTVEVDMNNKLIRFFKNNDQLLIEHPLKQVFFNKKIYLAIEMKNIGDKIQLCD